MNPLLQVNQLSIYHQAKQLVKPVNFTLYPDRPLTILGETGAGKSVILQSIMGILNSNLEAKGEVRLFNKICTRQERQAMWGSKITALPQEPWHALDPLMPSYQQVALVHEQLGQLEPEPAFNAAMSNLRDLGLAGSAQKRVGQLSGGMAQRLAVACATAGGAQILLADEPTKGLDVSRRDEVVNLLKRLTQGGGLLTITHDIEVAQALGGDILVLKNCEVVEQGAMAQVLAQPQHPYTRELIEASPKYWQSAPKQTQFEQPVMQVEALSIGRQTVLASNINFTIHAGEVVGVVGDSGCGKSTLGDTLLGLLPTKSGHIKKQIQAQPYQWQKLFQDPPSGLASHVTLNTLLDDLVELHQISRDKIAPLMQKLKLTPDLLTRQAREVSGGQLQRFAILRALLLEPVFLFADEPTSRLDPIVAKEITDVFIELAKENGCALLLVSHDPELIEKRCDTVVHLS
ncbi:MAG: ABC transporter ATP-binding protein [Vibrio sp.]